MTSIDPPTEMSRPSKLQWLKWILPIVALLIGAGATKALLSARKAPVAEPRRHLGPLVETAAAVLGDVTVTVSGQGEVLPRVRVELLPEVTGRVIKVHPRLVSGGRVGAGETLVEIDPRDYQLRVERARAAVARAAVALEREQAEAAAARDEWQAVNGDAEAPALLVREPQMRQAQAEVAAAEADLAAAELALERTRLSVPFDALVLSENVDAGQWISQGRAVATLVGTDAVEIRVPLDDAELRWLDGLELGRPSAAQGPRATVSTHFAGRDTVREGRVHRLEGQVDPRSRLVHVVVRVEDPFRSDGLSSDTPPLLPGTFAEVRIDGHPLAGVLTVPRAALRPDDVLWVIDGDELHIRAAEVLRRDRDRVILSAGGAVQAGDRVVISNLEAVADGLKVRDLAAQDAGGES